MPTIEELNAGFRLGDWEVLPSLRVLRREGMDISPEPMAFDVLMALAKRDGALASKDDIIDEVWNGRAFSDEPLQQKISMLRGHFGDSKPFEYIGTVHKRGYRLLKPVELLEPAVADGPFVGEARSLTRWKLTAALIAAGFLAIIALTWILNDGPPPPPPESIAIMPVDNLSGDPAKQYIVEGIKNTLAQRLSELPGFTIKNVKGKYEGEATDVSKALGVESMLYASVQVHNGALRIVYEIVNGSDGAILKSGEESGELDNLFGVQERLAKAVRDELAGAKTPELISRVAPDSEAYNSYLRGAYLLEHRFEEQNLEEAIRLFEESTEIDESYGPAYLGLATAYALMPDYREEPLEESLDRAVETIEKGVALDPRLADLASAIHGFVHYQRKEWTEAEKDYRRAISAEVVDTNAFSWYSQMLSCVGRLGESRDIALQGELVDPGSTVINSRIATIYTWLGNTAKAHEYFERANDLDATGIIHDMAYALFLKRTGQLDKSRTMALAAATAGEYETAWINPVFDALAEPTPENARVALAAINETWEAEGGKVIPHIVILVRTLLGDIEGAMAIARLLDNPGETFSMEILYIDELAPLRQHPEFMQLLKDLNVVAHWQEVGCRWEDERVVCDD
jgi:DNA-binding winged helix-turn-helix (wHTH) protein/TolB-like protein/Tfp pilus assembly protein PilF